MSDFASPQSGAASSRRGIQAIAKLVERRDEASMEEIEGIIKSDVAVTGKLMRTAYPRAPAREGATIQMATSRVGINYVIVLYIVDLLTQYVVDAFQTTAELLLLKDDPSLTPFESRHALVTSIKFGGKATGKISLVFSNAMAALLAERMLPPGTEITFDHLNQAVEAVSAVIAENLGSGLGAGKLPCTMEAMEISYHENFVEERVPGSTTEELYFRHETYGFRAHLRVNPFTLGR